MKKRIKDYSRNYIKITTVLITIYCYSILIRTALHPHLLVSHKYQLPKLVLALTLIYSVSKLRKGHLISWYMSVVSLSLLTISFLLHANKLHHLDLLFFVLTVILLFTLLLNKDSYKIKYPISSLKQNLIGPALLIIGLFIYGVTGFLYFDQSVFKREFTIQEAAVQTIKEIRPGTTDLEVSNKVGDEFIDTFPLLGLVTFVYVIYSLYRPAKFTFLHSSSDHAKAKILWNKYSTDTEDWFKLWPNNLHYFFYDECFIAFRVKKGTAIALGDPVGRNSDKELCIEAWLEFIKTQGWSAGAASVSEKYYEKYESSNLKSLIIGGEAIVNTNTFQTETIKSKHFRNVVNRARKLDYKFEVLKSPIDPEIMSELSKISNDWLIKGNRKERQFGLGYYNSSYISSCDTAVVKDSQGRCIAFANLIPCVSPSTASIDLMRYKSDANSIVMHYLLAQLIINQQEQGVQYFNLGLIPLAKVSLVTRERIKENMLLSLRVIGNKYYSFSGLEQFKGKFRPNISNKYIVYQPGKLPKFILSLERIMKIHS